MFDTLESSEEMIHRIVGDGMIKDCLLEAIGKQRTATQVVPKTLE